MSEALRILLVDDNPHDRSLVRRELRREFGELQFQEVTNEAEFAEVLSAAEFDVVITDYQIRWTNGLRVLRDVKERCPNCPVLMFTATGSEEIAVEAMKSGLDDYVIKNLHHIVRLRGAVRFALETSAIRRRAGYLESRLQILLTQLQIGAFSCSLDGGFLELNPAMTDLLGCRAGDEAPAKSLVSLFPNRSQGEAFLRQCAAAATAQQIEIEATQPSGEHRFLCLHVRCMGSANDDSPRLDGLVEDVTDRKRAEEQLQQAKLAQARIQMLSPREKQVLDGVVAGGMNKTIARRFDLSEKTIERHRSNMMKKLRVRSLADLVRLATLAEHADE
jgi:PAS domain S-box-containing protein